MQFSSICGLFWEGGHGLRVCRRVAANIWKVLGAGPGLVLPAALVVGLLTAPAALCGGSQRFTLWPQTKKSVSGESGRGGGEGVSPW